MLFSRLPAALACLAVLSGWIRAADPAAEDLEFFEKKIRPVLVEHCFKCHSDQAKAPKGGLRVDSRAHLLQGGDNGTSLVPGDPAKSKLIEAIRYKNTDLLMPPKAKLPEPIIADLERWVKAGAPWPAENKPPGTASKSELDIAKRKAEHWAWQSVREQTPPAVKNAQWPADPVDRFILAKLEAKGLKPAVPADKATWLRRVTFTLIGLPPSPAEIAEFLKDDSPQAFAKVVDRLLASPQFGERWGRHWLDLVRYAESRGHEFDPDIPNAYMYRDYIVRALNADVPYNRLVQEHLAGDVLPNPRYHPTTGVFESGIGTAFWHLGEEVHSPVDIRQDQADRLDNRIDVMTKAFMGLTVSCARCHDHKFDAIGSRDYYALYGILEGSSYRQFRVNGREQNHKVAAELAQLRQETSDFLRPKLAQKPKPVETNNKPFTDWLANAKVVVDYANLKPGEWLPDDVTFGSGPRAAGTVSIRAEGAKLTAQMEGRTAAVYDPFWAGLKLIPGTGSDHGALGRRPRAGLTIRTPNFVQERDNLYYLVRGGGMAYSAVCGHTVVHGPLHGGLVNTFAMPEGYHWVKHNLAAYKGQRLHVELSADPSTNFAIAMVVQADQPPPAVPPGSDYREPIASELVKDFQAREKALAERVVWESRLSPGLQDGTAVDEVLFVRGNPRTPGEMVPHRSLEALAGTKRIEHQFGSGRLEFALHITDPKQNPLIGRVWVNRVWHHLFGRGIVASTDNFGVLGELPTHPELLDYLASEFVQAGWSTKKLLRRLVLSSAYRMSSQGDPTAEAADPANELLHRFRLKRLEGEAIRDAILSVSGRLDRTVGGPPVPIYLTPFLDGRGRPGSGPLDGNGRRSIYLAMRRNFLAPFLQTFDTPIPFSTVGRRQVSNVPAQALILMNDPFVHQQADLWAKRMLAAPGSLDDKLTDMYLTAYGRSPGSQELASCREFIQGRETDLKAWTDLTHALFNVKEFVFVK